MERQMGEDAPEKRTKVPDMNIEQATTVEPVGPDHGSDARLDTDVQRFIGNQLRAVYDEVVKEPVPDRFVKLLEELERKRAKRS